MTVHEAIATKRIASAVSQTMTFTMCLDECTKCHPETVGLPMGRTLVRLAPFLARSVSHA